MLVDAGTYPLHRGDWWFTPSVEEPQRIYIGLPRGAGTINLPIARKSAFRGDGWTWNGSTDKPTLEPSIRKMGGRGGRWHGSLTDGVLIDAADQ